MLLPASTRHFQPGNDVVNRFLNILCVGTDSDGDNGVVERAVALAEKNQARLTLLSVVPRINAGTGMPEGGPISAELQAWLVAERERFLTSLATPCYGRRHSVAKQPV